jgi:DnaJ-class molecular chaperone
MNTWPVWLVLAVLLIFFWRHRRKYMFVATSVKCPRCSTSNSLSDFTCTNCKRKGGIEGKVIGAGIKQVFFTCRYCNTSAVRGMTCTSCNTDLQNLFKRQSGAG